METVIDDIKEHQCNVTQDKDSNYIYIYKIKKKKPKIHANKTEMGNRKAK